MGLEQKITRVSRTDLNKFYAVHLKTIIAPYNPELDHDYIHTLANNCDDLENLYTQAMINDDADTAKIYHDHINKLLRSYEESDIWYGEEEDHIHQWVTNTYAIEEANLNYVLIDPNKMFDDLKTDMNNSGQTTGIIPTSSEFFFADTDYTEYYLDSIMKLYNTLSEDKDFNRFDNHAYFYWSCS